jgi:nucleoside-diphosphate-sugar epimerase
MKVFLTGASGYIGGTVAVRLLRDGHEVHGLVRTSDKAERLKAIGVVPVMGTLDDLYVLRQVASWADAVVNAASSDHRPAVDTLLAALEGTQKIFLHTSGSSVVSDTANGEPSDAIFTEETPVQATPEKVARLELDRAVTDAAKRGIRSAVICNCLIYGVGLGIQRHSIQLPSLIAQARKSGIVRHVGRGLNRWSTIHVEDVAEIYARSIASAPPGMFVFAESGEEQLRDLTAAISERLGLAEPQDWPIEDAEKEWGHEYAVYALGSNSRVRSVRSRTLLGWVPRPGTALDWIREGDVA